MTTLQRSTLTLTRLSLALGLLASSGCGDNGTGDDEVGDTGDTTTGDGDGDTSETTAETTAETTDDPTETTAETTDDPTETTAETSETETETETGDEIPPCPYAPVDGDPAFGLEVVAEGLSAPTFVIGHPQIPDRLYVTEKSGAIKIVEPGSTTANPEPFLTLAVNDFSEMGVLSMDFHPDFPDDPRVYVHYSPQGPLRSRISEFTLDANNPDIVDSNSERIIYDKEQSQGNHNGGQVHFGPDGYLYFSIGDGGEQGDPNNRAQNLGTHYGKVMRVDITPSGNLEYTIPADNPFVNTQGALPEIWAYGFRNPWRFSFDSETGWMYLGDVGQNAWEEIDIIEAGGNYGWRPMEGNHCFGQNNCDTSAGPNQENADGYIAPIHDYGGANRSVSGGYVYRSCEVPAWQGRYYFADYVLNDLYALTWDGTNVDYLGQQDDTDNIVSFGTNAWGDVYVVEANIGFQPPHPANSRIFRITPQ
ncbi:MAG: PQQ-dependent sugar dehydrogenase [Deltaproteobacteria bacterium]|nr:PQQ-dependent sugar dehydrogenase [Deltaproteobacteria bacterium]